MVPSTKIEKKTMPAQEQDERPGKEHKMTPEPAAERTGRTGKKLEGKVAIVTGGDSGIGRAVAIAFAQEGADVAVAYLSEHKDAEETRRRVEKHGRKCLLISADLGYEDKCREVMDKTLKEFKRLDVLVNNAAEQHPQPSLEEITAEQLEHTFRTNIFAYFYLTKAALPHLKKGATIINTTSVTAYKGNPMLLDYSSTKGAIVAFTRSLSLSVAESGIRVNGVAPGPIWTPLIPSTFDAEKTGEFGGSVPLKRPGQPEEVAPSFVFLASNDSSYMTGQILHPNGGSVING